MVFLMELFAEENADYKCKQKNPEDMELIQFESKERMKKYIFFSSIMKISIDELTKLRICLETHLDASNHM